MNLRRMKEVAVTGSNKRPSGFLQGRKSTKTFRIICIMTQKSKNNRKFLKNRHILHYLNRSKVQKRGWKKWRQFNAAKKLKAQPQLIHLN